MGRRGGGPVAGIHFCVGAGDYGAAIEADSGEVAADRLRARRKKGITQRRRGHRGYAEKDGNITR